MNYVLCGINSTCADKSLWIKIQRLTFNMFKRMHMKMQSVKWRLFIHPWVKLVVASKQPVFVVWENNCCRIINTSTNLDVTWIIDGDTRDWVRAHVLNKCCFRLSTSDTTRLNFARYPMQPRKGTSIKCVRFWTVESHARITYFIVSCFCTDDSYKRCPSVSLSHFCDPCAI